LQVEQVSLVHCVDRKWRCYAVFSLTMATHVGKGSAARSPPGLVVKVVIV